MNEFVADMQPTCPEHASPVAERLDENVNRYGCGCRYEITGHMSALPRNADGSITIPYSGVWSWP